MLRFGVNCANNGLVTTERTARYSLARELNADEAFLAWPDHCLPARSPPTDRQLFNRTCSKNPKLTGAFDTPLEINRMYFYQISRYLLYR